MQSNVFTKWLERICLGPRPGRLLLSKFPLWGFWPGLSASQLALALQFSLHASLSFASRSALAPAGESAAAQGEGDDIPYVVFVDVEKAFDNMLLGHQLENLLDAGLDPGRVAAY